MKIRVAAILYVLLILALTLTPSPEAGIESRGVSVCLLCGERGLADAILNLGLFVPFGMLVARMIGPGRAAASGVLLSLFVEAAQTRIPGRFTSLADVLSNGAGAALGAFALSFVVARVLQDQTVSRVAAGAWTVACFSAFVATGLLMSSPTAPGAAFYGQWTPDLGDFETYGGQVIEASVGGSGVPSRRFDDTDAMRGFLNEGAPINVRFILGPPSAGLAPIFNVFNDRRQGIFILAADGDDLVFRRRYMADDLRFDRPDTRVLRALAPFSSGDTVSVHVETARGGGYVIGVEGRSEGPRGSEPQLGDREVAPIGHTIGRGWSLLLYPDDLGEFPMRTVDLLWLVVLAVPVSLSGARGALLAAAVLFPALVAVPAVTPLLATPWEEYGAVAAGLLFGCFLWPAARKRSMVSGPSERDFFDPPGAKSPETRLNPHDG